TPVIGSQKQNGSFIASQHWPVASHLQVGSVIGSQPPPPPPQFGSVGSMHAQLGSIGSVHGGEQVMPVPRSHLQVGSVSGSQPEQYGFIGSLHPLPGPPMWPMFHGVVALQTSNARSRYAWPSLDITARTPVLVSTSRR